ncbi:MAG: phenylalanine--tRNA ligase subunit alpha [Thermoplasmata archaeon]
MELSNVEKTVLLRIKEKNGRSILVSELLKEGFKSMVELMNALSWLKMKGLLKLDEVIKTEYIITAEGKYAIENGLAERIVFNYIRDNGINKIDSLIQNINKKTVTLGISHLKDLGCRIDKGIIEILDPGEVDLRITERELFIKNFKTEKNEDLLKHFLKRGMIEKKDIVERIVTLTDIGIKIINEGIELKEEVSQVTPELIQTGRWKGVEFRKYDVSLFAPKIYPGKIHPITSFIQQIRSIFLRMGFEEITGEYIQSAFWNMDALYIPQDHPAREMQDTFYLSYKNFKLPDYKDTVKSVHENGFKESTGWGYKWSEDIAKKPLLRTHTTVNSIHYLFENREKETFKVFTIGRVFRRENMDPTHLPEFTQIEGIMTEKNANLSMLMGLIKEFYRAMGFMEIKLKPSYFPYTEPSVEIDVKYNDRWLELGGAGIFRIEVTEPLGIKTPVLAWGLGLERLAMLYFGIQDIRELYVSDIEKLKNLKLL